MDEKGEVLTPYKHQQALRLHIMGLRQLDARINKWVELPAFSSLLDIQLDVSLCLSTT